MSRGFAVSSLGLVVLFAGCRFPELPVIGEDAGDAPEADALIDAPPSSDAVDAAIDAVDARPVRTGPLVTNGQAADLVIGQPSFGTNADRGVTAQSFQPDGIAFASGRLWATDYFHRRVLGWNSPTASDPAAGYLLGQSLFTVDADQGVSQTSIFQAQDVEAVGTKVLVADGMNRVLIWTSLPVAAAQPADLVLGQPDFTTANVGTGPSQMRVPWGPTAHASSPVAGFSHRGSGRGRASRQSMRPRQPRCWRGESARTRRSSAARAASHQMAPGWWSPIPATIACSSGTRSRRRPGSRQTSCLANLTSRA